MIEILEKLFIENGSRLITEVYSFDGLERDIQWRNQVYKL